MEERERSVEKYQRYKGKKNSGEELEFKLTCWWACKLVQPLQKTVQLCPLKLKSANTMTQQFQP